MLLARSRKRSWILARSLRVPTHLGCLSKEPGRPSRPDVSPDERPSPFVISVFARVETNLLFARFHWFFRSKEDQEPGSPQFFSVLQEDEEHPRTVGGLRTFSMAYALRATLLCPKVYNMEENSNYRCVKGLTSERQKLLLQAPRMEAKSG